MNGEEFKKLALRTEPKDMEYIQAQYRLNHRSTVRLLHAAMGLCTEAAEFLDVLKKHIFYGKNIDEVNLLEEVGDSDWYKAIALDTLDKPFEEVWVAVINKLSKRYGLEFNVEGAINRNLESERESLEKDFNGYTDEYIHFFSPSGKVLVAPICAPKPGYYRIISDSRQITCPNCKKWIKVNYE